MKNHPLTISSKGQITIPRAARLRLGLDAGAKLSIQNLTDSTITLEREYTIDDLYGKATKLWSGQDPVQVVRGLRDDQRA